MLNMACSGLIVLFMASPLLAQTPHPDVVAEVKAQLEATQVDLSGPCGAFKITTRVAWRVRSEGWGLLDKPAGNQCQGYAVDYLVHRSGAGADILVDAGGANGPAWQPSEPDPDLAARWRAPFDPDPVPVPAPPPAPPPPIPAVDLTPVVQRLDALAIELAAHEAAEREFREQVRTTYRDALAWLAKYVLPAVAAFLGGRAL